jgi:hypothetical protein
MKLVKYYVSKLWYPQLEVDILCKEGVSETRKAITDIDVMGLYPSTFGYLHPVLGDCKTQKNQSPINRALWMKGLMELTGAKYGIIILEKSIEGDHKLTANELQITLLSDKDLDVYSKSTSSESEEYKSALCVGENWDKYFDIMNKFTNLKSLLTYVKSGFWNEKDGSSKLRHLLSHFRLMKNELNPENKLHLGIVTDIASLFGIAMNEIVCSTFNQYLLPTNKDQLEQELKVLIWGGLENYQYWNSLRKKMINNVSSEDADLTLPEWNMFLQLIRSCLDDPYATSVSPLLLKELAFEFISDNNQKAYFTFSHHLAIKNKQAAKFALLTAEYICKSAKLPPEFIQTIADRLMKIQRTE